MTVDGGFTYLSYSLPVAIATTSLQISMELEGSGPVHGFVPVNHPVTFSASLTEQNVGVVRT